MGDFKIGMTRLLKVTVWLSYIYGLWPRVNSTIIYTIYGYIFQLSTSVLWIILKTIASLLMDDLKLFILFNGTSCYGSVAVYRALALMRKYKNVDVCLNTISEFQLSKTEYEIIQPKMKTFSKLSSTYNGFIFIGMISAYLNPVLSAERALPVPIWIPFLNWEGNARDFYIVLTFSYISMNSVVHHCAFTPIIVWYLIHGSSLMIEVLGHRLRKLGHERKSSKKHYHDLVQCIKTHQEIHE